MPDTRTYRVQMEDGSTEEFRVDTRVSNALLPSLLEGAVRARMRQKSGQPPAPAPTTPDIFAPTISENIRRGVAGAAEIPINAAKDFAAGAQYINKSPLDALSLLPELVRTPIQNAVKGVQRLRDLSQQQTTPGAPPIRASDLADVVNAIPIAGPLATSTGERMASGQGPEAIGNLAGQALLADLGTKYGNVALAKVGRPRVQTGPNLSVRIPGVTVGPSTPASVSIPGTARLLPAASRLAAATPTMATEPLFGRSVISNMTPPAPDQTPQPNPSTPGPISSNTGKDDSRIRGQADVPISPKGIANTQDLAKRIATSGGLDMLLSGPLGRHTDTAQVLGGGYTPTRVLPELNGLSYGVLEGLPTDALKDVIKYHLQDHPDIPLPGISPYTGKPGDSLNGFKSRVLPVISGIMKYADANPDQSIGVIVNRQTVRTTDRWLNAGGKSDFSVSNQPNKNYDSTMYRIKDNKLMDSANGLSGGGVYLIPHGITQWNSPGSLTGSS